MNLVERLNDRLTLRGFQVTLIRSEDPAWRSGYCPPVAKRMVVRHLATNAEFDCRVLYCHAQNFMKMPKRMELHFKEHGLMVTAVWVLKMLHGPAGAAAVKEELRDHLLNTTLLGSG